MITKEELMKVAAKETRRAAELKDYKCRNRHNREMRRIAREMAENGGFMLASNVEMALTYGEIFEKQYADCLMSPAKRCWFVEWNIVNRKVEFNMAF